MKKLLLSLSCLLAVILVNAQASSIPYTGLLISSGTAGPAGDDDVANATIPFTFYFYGTGYTTARISTNGFIWLGTSGSNGCCDGFLIPSDGAITNSYISLTQTDWLPDAPANGTIFYAVTGTAPNRVFVVHYENIKHISSADRMTGEIQLYETTNEIRLVMSNLTGIAGGSTATMGIAKGDGATGYAVGTRNQSTSYSITNEAWSLLTPSSTLPVKIKGYEAKKVSGTSVIEWSTSFEENNSHFVIEHSANGRDFKQMGRVNSKGNTTAGHQYSFTDVNPLTGKNYYRLVQYDLDGKSVYHGIMLLNFEWQSDIKIMPNPVTSKFNIAIESKQASTIQITVLDIQGRKIASFSEQVKTGSNLIPVTSKEWPTGFYTVKIDQDGIITTHKLIKNTN